MRINPYTGEALPTFESTDALSQIAQLREKQAVWKRTPIGERCQRLLDSLEYLENHREPSQRIACINRRLVCAAWWQACRGLWF